MIAMDDSDNCSLGLEYEHQSLPDASNYIRLLTAKAHDGDGSHILDCDLTTWRIEDSPAFSAISYSWGDPAQTALLQINGRSLRVTKNCEVALCQATLCRAKLSRSRGAHGSDKRYFWCDAVCIDQKNQAEREAQVVAMGRVYRRAEHVLACLGAPVDGTDDMFLFRRIQSRSGLLRSIGEHWLPDDEFQLDIARMTDDKWTRMVTWFILSMPRCSIIRLCTALESLLAAPYFQRTWICQELFLGREVIVTCGLESVQMSCVYGLAQTRSLGSLMWKIRYQECGDIRDKVYGTLSMVRWPDDEAISVDYGRDIFDLAIQVMAVIKQRPGGWDSRCPED
ncbi:hypothetical protein KVR01_013301 [Diaporthe batatas]|uniref:uncharacterized protein n=1 Tax=Diaporthe batatas TaxID=748121 RepID=UPI001D048FDD|nr:uncharacterized protein KVR01_013301 [Diaporthe batatas]KAG8156888.1 hypothetical protein KVR01_013301 [Diaporthe batatas]